MPTGWRSPPRERTRRMPKPTRSTAGWPPGAMRSPPIAPNCCAPGSPIWSSPPRGHDGDRERCASRFTLPRDLPDGPRDTHVPRLSAHDRRDPRLVRGERGREARHPRPPRRAPSHHGSARMNRARWLGLALVLSLLAGCGGAGDWAKAGGDEAAASREYEDCRALAGGAVQTDADIDQDILATRQSDW